MRAALGDGYVEALRSTWSDLPESADYVMYWWHHAAGLVNAGEVQRFGFITTNSLKQTFNRRVVQTALDAGLHLAFAIPDHPWVDSADGAAVRIAMTVGTALKIGEGKLLTVASEREAGGEGLEVTLTSREGKLHADLRVGADVADAKSLRANAGISNRGLEIGGAGFIVTPEDAAKLEADAPIRPYRNGRDLTDRPRGVKIIDLFGLTAEEVRSRYPATYQWIFERVKPERDQNRMDSVRENWWLHRRLREDLRASLTNLPRYIATVETAKHRAFQFLDADIAPDNKLICIALADAYPLGVLSSIVHVTWVLAAGSTLEDRPVYVKTTCFETFPFPAATAEQQARIRDLADQLDAHRKRQQAQHAKLTLTGMYNVLSKIRTGETLTAKDKTIHEQGLVSVLQTLHDELDAAVLEAYGWAELKVSDSETLLERLVALNAERAREEANGQIRWLRPSFQNPQASLAVDSKNEPKTSSTVSNAIPTTLASSKHPWPPSLPDQMALLIRLLNATPQSEPQLAAQITGKGPWKKRLPDLLQTLVALGRARQDGENWMAV